MFDFTRLQLCAGSTCAAKYGTRWYRAVIVNHLAEENLLEVRFVDLGKKVFVNVNDVRPLKPQFLTKPSYSFFCHLFGVDTPGDDGVDMSGEMGKFAPCKSGGYVIKTRCSCQYKQWCVLHTSGPHVGGDGSIRGPLLTKYQGRVQFDPIVHQVCEV